MVDPITNQAIDCALRQEWKEAIRLNISLLDANELDLAALNRLAFAYLKSGNILNAKNTYKKVLKIDKYNPIATKNLQWLTNLTKSDIHQNQMGSPSPTIFLEEPGKTKIVTLVNPAHIRVLCNLMTSQKVELIPKKHSIEIRDGHNIYIGALPDDLSHRLLPFIQAGNTYDVYIKNVAKNAVSVFIRESKRSKKLLHITSFPVNKAIRRPKTDDKDDGDETGVEKESENEETSTETSQTTE